MNLPDNLLPSDWYWTGQGLFALVLFWAIRTATWSGRDNARHLKPNK